MSRDLFNAIDAHDFERFASILKAGADPNEPLDLKPYWRPLEAVIEEVHHDGPPETMLEMLKLLIRHGADVNVWDARHAMTPLLFAAYWDNRDAVRALLEAGADPNVESNEGLSPLRWAVEAGDREMTSLLLRHDARRSIDKYGGFAGFTPLAIAARRLDLPMIELLLEAGANAEALDSDGRTAREHLPPRDKSNPQVWDAALELLARQSM
jgi:uncharacterized protein